MAGSLETEIHEGCDGNPGHYEKGQADSAYSTKKRTSP